MTLISVVLKLLFKSMLPLVIITGVMSYGIYMRGGDATVLWQRLADGALAPVLNTVKTAQHYADSATDVTGFGEGGTDETASGLTQVYTWKDANGTTHFSSGEPAGASATLITVNPNVNVLVADTLTQSSGNRTQQREINDTTTASSRGTGYQAEEDSALPEEIRNPNVEILRQLEEALGGSLTY